MILSRSRPRTHARGCVFALRRALSAHSKCHIFTLPHRTGASQGITAHHRAAYKTDLKPFRLSNSKRQQHRISRVADRRRELKAGNGWAFYRLVELTVGSLPPNPTLVQRAAKVGYEPEVTDAATWTKVRFFQLRLISIQPFHDLFEKAGFLLGFTLTNKTALF